MPLSLFIYVSLVLICTCASMVRASHIESQTAFTNWMQHYSKSYTSYDFHERYEIFQSNMAFVNSWNSNPDNTHRVHLNRFADLSNKEYQANFLGFRQTTREERSMEPFEQEQTESTLPPFVSWTALGVVTEVKDQGNNCAAGWAFAAVGAVETARALSSGNLVSLSAQNLIDCTMHLSVNAGCRGGNKDVSFGYIQKNGIAEEATYPYKAASDTEGASCKYSADSVAATISNMGVVTSESHLKRVVANQPVSVAIDASLPSFQLYESGVYSDVLCSRTDLNHAVLVTGYGTSSSGWHYWLIKNSWSTQWGEQGYFRLARNAGNKCGVATSATYPII